MFDKIADADGESAAAHSSSIVACQCDGGVCITACVDSSVKVWDIATARETMCLAGHSVWAMACAISSQHNVCISGSHDTTLAVYNLSTGKRVKRLRGHSDAVVGCALSPDGTRAYSCSTDGTARAWQLGTFECLWSTASRPGGLSCCCLAEDLGLLLLGATDGLVVAVKLADGTTAWKVAADASAASSAKGVPEVRSCAFDPEHHRLACTLASGVVMVRQLDADGSGPGHVLWSGRHADEATACCFSPDGHILFSACRDASINVWASDSGRSLAGFVCRTNAIECLGCSEQDGNLYAVAGDRTGQLVVLRARSAQAHPEALEASQA